MLSLMLLLLCVCGMHQLPLLLHFLHDLLVLCRCLQCRRTGQASFVVLQLMMLLLLLLLLMLHELLLVLVKLLLVKLLLFVLLLL